MYVTSFFFLLSFQPGDFVHTLGDAHVYTNHIEPLKLQVGQYASRHINTAILICSGGGCCCWSFLRHFIKITAVLNMLHLSPSAAGAGHPSLPKTENPKESEGDWRFLRRGFWNLWLQPSSCHQNADGCLIWKLWFKKKKVFILEFF